MAGEKVQAIHVHHVEAPFIGLAVSGVVEARRDGGTTSLTVVLYGKPIVVLKLSNTEASALIGLIESNT